MWEPPYKHVSWVTTKELYNFLRNILRDKIYGIESWMKVSTSIKSVLHAVDKEFSLCANYPK